MLGSSYFSQSFSRSNLCLMLGAPRMELALLLAQTRDTCKVFGDEQCLPLLKAGLSQGPSAKVVLPNITQTYPNCESM